MSDDARRWRVPLLLLALTFASMLWAGATQVHLRAPGSLGELLDGWVFAVPFLAIMLSHELGHYVAARRHGVDASPPYFIPMPVFLGTMGAIISMKGRIRSRNALLDVGAAGPLAGLVVALPVLAYGLATSPVEPLPEGQPLLVEGRSLLYLAFLRWAHGEIPPGHDVMLSPTALAGWAGLLVTMINLLPVGQLDGGHVAYALLGERQNRWSNRVHAALPLVALLVGLAYAAPAAAAGAPAGEVANRLAAGVHWLVWAGVLWVLRRVGGTVHPPTDPGALSPRRRAVAVLSLLLFVLLFMPSWIHEG